MRSPDPAAVGSVRKHTATVTATRQAAIPSIRCIVAFMGIFSLYTQFENSPRHPPTRRKKRLSYVKRLSRTFDAIRPLLQARVLPLGRTRFLLILLRGRRNRNKSHLPYID